jgi:crossover junction endodeoxyribonuclease RuvC
MIVLGIDPGSSVTGYGIIQSNNNSHLNCLDYGCIRLSSKKELNVRLKEIYDGIELLVSQANPDDVALEDIFYSRNIKSALQLGQARGAAVIAALNNNKTVASYSPKEVKQSVTGNGGASKEQVQRMVLVMLKLGQQKLPLDVTDALAIAMCHINRSWTILQTGHKQL